MESIDANGNKVYNLSAGRLFPNVYLIEFINISGLQNHRKRN